MPGRGEGGGSRGTGFWWRCWWLLVVTVVVVVCLSFIPTFFVDRQAGRRFLAGIAMLTWLLGFNMTCGSRHVCLG